MILILLLYALFASVFTIEKTCLQYSQPLFMIGSRMLLAGVIMIGYQCLFQRNEFRLQTSHIWMFLLLAIFNIYLTNIFEVLALSNQYSSKTCFIYNLSPFVSALLSYFIFSEKLSWKKWLGLFIGFVGFIPIIMNKTSIEGGEQFFFLSTGEILMLLAVVCSVYGWILLRQVVRDEGYTSFSANGISMFIGGGLALTHSYCVEDWNPLPVSNLFSFLEYSLLLMIISNIICYNLYGTLLKRYSATLLSFAGFTTPFFTAFFSWVFLGEDVTPVFFVSISIVFIGLLTFSQEELPLKYKKFLPVFKFN